MDPINDFNVVFPAYAKLDVSFTNVEHLNSHYPENKHMSCVFQVLSVNKSNKAEKKKAFASVTIRFVDFSNNRVITDTLGPTSLVRMIMGLRNRKRAIDPNDKLQFWGVDGSLVPFPKARFKLEQDAIFRDGGKHYEDFCMAWPKNQKAPTPASFEKLVKSLGMVPSTEVGLSQPVAPPSIQKSGKKKRKRPMEKDASDQAMSPVRPFVDIGESDSTVGSYRRTISVVKAIQAKDFPNARVAVGCRVDDTAAHALRPGKREGRITEISGVSCTSIEAKVRDNNRLFLCRLVNPQRRTYDSANTELMRWQNENDRTTSLPDLMSIDAYCREQGFARPQRLMRFLGTPGTDKTTKELTVNHIKQAVERLNLTRQDSGDPDPITLWNDLLLDLYPERPSGVSLRFFCVAMSLLLSRLDKEGPDPSIPTNCKLFALLTKSSVY